MSSNGKIPAGKILNSKLVPSGECNTVNKITEQSACFCFKSNILINLVKFVEIYEDSSPTLPMMLFELEEENLNAFLKCTKDALTVLTKLNLSHDIAKGLDHLHINM